MSAVVGTICSSQNPGIILSSNINKEVEHKADDNIESISCKLKAENADIICKDLIKEMSKRTTGHSEDNCVVKQDDDACLKSEDSAKDKALDKDDKVRVYLLVFNVVFGWKEIIFQKHLAHV